MAYKNPTPVVVGLIPVEVANPNWDSATTTMLVAIERGTEPFIGGFAFPGGYIDEGETAEVAIAREILEEMGVETQARFWRPLVTLITPNNRLLVFMRYYPFQSAESFVFTPTNEALSMKLVTSGDTLCFPLHQEVLGNKQLWM
jgi:ADP-ribose pyrophosphatase YjhB (NUDIX family)